MAASFWVHQLGNACPWGSVVIAAVYTVCRVLPRLPAGVRVWLWWLACARLLLGLWIAAPINLPVLPASAPSPFAVSTTAAPPTAQTIVSSKRRDLAVAAVLPAAAVSPTSAQQVPRWPLVLLAAWLLGIGVSLAPIARQSIAMAEIRRGTVPALLPNFDLKALAAQIGLRRVPHVVTGPNVLTPCVAGWLRPTILLPPNFSEILTASEIRLTLAHELAHVKRCDLPLAAVPMLARTLFFFNPLVWIAAAEWAAAREEACDALALLITNTSRAEYGRLLLKLADPKVNALALGLSPGYHSLRRRLVSLAYAKQTPRWARFLVLALPLLLPWHLSAALPVHSVSLADAALTSYTVTPIAGGLDGSVSGLNNSGQAALSADTQGYVGGENTLAALGALPKHHASFAYAINNSGQAAGASFNILGHARAFVWDGNTHKIGSLPGYPYSEARGISDTGEIVGFAEIGRSDRLRAWVSRAFVRQPGGQPLDIGTLGGPYSAACAVNASGTVAGKADTDSGATHAFTWNDTGGMTDLGTLGGANSAAYAVSSTDAAAGVSETDTGTRHAFVFADGQMHDLVPLPGMGSSAAFAVSADASVVGTSLAANGVKRATLWQNGRPTDLNTLLPPHSGWVLTEARAVNDHGQIAGQGLWNGRPCAFLLTPR